MNDVTQANFGILIAYLLPGSVALFGIGLFSETVQRWLGASAENVPTLGGFLYVTLAAIAAGLFVSTVRWIIVDRIHHMTGIHEPAWDFARLERRLPAYQLLIANHYVYYKWHANASVAVLFAFVAFLFWSSATFAEMGLPTAGFAFVESVLWLGSRDTLRKYYRRVEMLMRQGTVDGGPHGGRSSQRFDAR